MIVNVFAFSFIPVGLPMNFILHPWQLYFVILAGWINRQQQIVIDYLRTENQVLKEKLGKIGSCSAMISDADWQ